MMARKVVRRAVDERTRRDRGLFLIVSVLVRGRSKLKIDVPAAEMR